MMYLSKGNNRQSWFVAISTVFQSAL